MRGHITRGRSAGTWYLRVELQHSDNGKRRQRRETVRGAKADAQRRLRELLHEVEGGGYADAQRLTVAKIAERWLATKEHRVAAKTFAFYSSHIRLYIVPTLGSLRAEALRPAYIEAAIGKWARGERNDRERRRTLSSIRCAPLSHVAHDPAVGREDGNACSKRRRCCRAATLRAQGDARA